MSRYSYRTTQTYDDSVLKYANDKNMKAALIDTIQALTANPFRHPTLGTHRVKRAQGETFVSDVGGRKGKRLIWRLVGKRTIVFLLIDEHDPAYRRAETLRLEIDDEEERLRVYDADPRTGVPKPYAELRQREGTLYLAYRDEELKGFGFQNHELPALRALDSEAELLHLEKKMGSQAWRMAMNLYLYGHPEGEEAAVTQAKVRESLEGVIPEPKTDADHEKRIANQLSRPSARAEFAPVELEELSAVLTKPIEDWMIFLHPEQANLAERPYSGPARVRGAAGTGKTVVGLHRAKHLARTYDKPILFTTYIRTLPAVLRELFRRLAPGLSDRVEFRGIHSWAARYLHAAGHHPRIDVHAVNSSFFSAWNSVASGGTFLADTRLPANYYREEIDWVIKGRNLKDADSYLALERSGRGTPFDRRHREAVWSLYDEYQRQLCVRRTHDFNDLLIEAYSTVRDVGVSPGYASVIVDEAQDLTEVAVKLVYELAGRDKPDGLLLLGDGQQSIYPGGFGLSAIGIDVRGRAAVLTRNYRNTRQILDLASRIVAGRPFDDGEESLVDGHRNVTVLRHGDRPTVSAYEHDDDHDLALALAIANCIELPGVELGDVAVLVPTRRLVHRYVDRIGELELPTLDLERYDGKPSSQVRVGTYKRAKGLEFKHVFLPQLGHGQIGELRRPGENDATHSERVDLLRRQLFVAMTRARDGLWLGWVGAPSELLRLPREV